MEELAEEGVGRNIKDTMAVDVKVDMVGRHNNGVGEEVVNSEGRVEGD